MSDQIMPGLAASSFCPAEEKMISSPASPDSSLSDSWKAWDKFVEATPESGFMQSSWSVEFRNYCGFENFGITLTDGEEIAGGAVVLKISYADNSCFYYIQDGPVLPSDSPAAEEVFHAILDAIEERRESQSCVVSHLRIEPRRRRRPGSVCGLRCTPPLAEHHLEARRPRCIHWR